MGLLFPVAAILAGILAAAGVIIDKRPDAKELIEKMAPYQAAIGLTAMVLGLFQLFSIQILWRASILTFVAGLGTIGGSAVAGFLLGFPLLQKYVLSDMSEESQKKSEDMRKKLVPYKVTAGLFSLAGGIYILLYVIGRALA